MHVTSPFRQVVVPVVPPEDVDAAPALAATWDWQQTLLWLYAAGAIFVLLRLGWHLCHLLLIARRYPAVQRDGLNVVYVSACCRRRARGSLTVERDKFQVELGQLTKMQQQLKGRLAELKSGK